VTRWILPACLAVAVLGCKKEVEKRSPLAEAARACSDESELSCPRPILNVRSLEASQRYYRDALGFKVDWAYGDPPDFGSVSRGHGVLFMCQGCQGTPGAWVMMFTPDVDALHDEVRRKGALIRMPPTNMPWGLREMHVSDPDGNVLRFGTGIDD
jgi:catechol 2,3-dioxygenase-like lactoylglutathione lyase family enzyme